MPQSFHASLAGHLETVNREAARIRKVGDAFEVTGNETLSFALSEISFELSEASRNIETGFQDYQSQLVQDATDGVGGVLKPLAENCVLKHTGLDTETRKLAVPSAQIWFDGAKDRTQSTENRLLYLVNALNHTENALCEAMRILVAVQDEPTCRKALDRIPEFLDLLDHGFVDEASSD